MADLLSQPRVEVLAQRRFAGLVKRYDLDGRGAIPAQWQDYNKAAIRVAGALPGGYFGVVFNHSDDGRQFDYLCGQEVPLSAALPRKFGEVTIEGPYACFATQVNVSAMQAVWAEVYATWLKRPDYRPRPGPTVEYYPPAFDGDTGHGGFEVWLSVVG